MSEAKDPIPSQSNATVKGKTDINGKPFERQKRMDDERLWNGSQSVRTVCETVRTDE